ncbi:hypothetical protein PM082_018545 [Marasmius tenuissimus]|nr:hypothetical protein PM082_018545 [Marasmius tenuissimus]
MVKAPYISIMNPTYMSNPNEWTFSLRHNPVARAPLYAPVEDIGRPLPVKQAYGDGGLSRHDDLNAGWKTWPTRKEEVGL